MSLGNHNEYRRWIKSIEERFRQSQIKAAVSVNREMLALYWSIGKDIVSNKVDNKWGGGFFEKLSKDMSDILPGVHGFSSSNLRYMKKFYEIYHTVILPQVVGELGEEELCEKFPQIVGELGEEELCEKFPQIVGELGEEELCEKLPQAVGELKQEGMCEKFPQVVGELGEEGMCEKSPQVVGELSKDELLSIPWGHHRVIIDKCKGNINKSIFFIKKTIENNWSRAVLLNFLETDLYERRGKAVSNFRYSLPAVQSALAQEITRDPYNFTFLTMKEDYDEKELKDALLDNITKFLMELGKGFSFVGREYVIPIEGTEEKIDLLFYHLNLHCYIVIEVKVIPFNSRDIGQVGTYVNIVDNLVKTDTDAKTIGLIICKSKNNVLAKYAVNSSREPIGISEYELSHFLSDRMCNP
ncbi:MAG: PDDEXK nuclease domain-containing protein [Lachnospiraceae bacterium]|nr:PDDEXK nuclease domain-containing protein [Lachnospiraceae bacterium]